MRDIILVIDVLSVVGLVVLVLLQQGKGADMRAAFYADVSQTLFGARVSIRSSQSHDRDPGDGIFEIEHGAGLGWCGRAEGMASVTRSVTETVLAPGGACGSGTRQKARGSELPIHGIYRITHD